MLQQSLKFKYHSLKFLFKFFNMTHLSVTKKKTSQTQREIPHNYKDHDFSCRCPFHVPMPVKYIFKNDWRIYQT